MKSLKEILNIYTPKEKSRVLKLLGLKSHEFDYYNENHILPSNHILDQIKKEFDIDRYEVMLKMGIYNDEIKTFLAENAKELRKMAPKKEKKQVTPDLTLELSTELGALYKGDCLSLLNNTPDNTFDLIFADPPFNINKIYPSQINDQLHILDYIRWTEQWLEECMRTLKEGGSLLLWNLPKWNTYFSTFLNQRLNFKHWISVDIKYTLPIPQRLYPSHYSLLYYVKGEKANTFHPDRLPMEICPKCYVEIKDYGGYKNKMNPRGINMSDVWLDIPPVRHNKYKGRKDANELSIKLLDRIIEMASKEGDLIFDPFGGSGTTYIVSEIKNRRWLGVELGPIEDIINRFININNDTELLDRYRSSYNKLFPPSIEEKREKLNLWTCKSFSKED